MRDRLSSLLAMLSRQERPAGTQPAPESAADADEHQP
jgi:hypothetical protein